MEVIQLTQPARRRLFLKKKSSKLHFESLYIVEIEEGEDIKIWHEF